MQILYGLLVILISYIMGSIPAGLLIVRIATGKDIRTIASGRTGGTNAMRAAGFWAGLGTAVFDILKGAASVWLARWMLPDSSWLHMLAPVAAVLGHNYSIFLIWRGEDRKLRLRGGAGGAPCAGGALGMWAPSLLFIVPLAGLILYFVGYASVATLSAGVAAFLIFAWRAWQGFSPWEYALYGIICEVLLLWALRPNIQRLIQGNERLVGYRSRNRKVDFNLEKEEKKT